MRNEYKEFCKIWARLCHIEKFLEDNFNYISLRDEQKAKENPTGYQPIGQGKDSSGQPQVVKPTGSDLLGFAARESAEIDSCSCGRPGFICGIQDCAIISKT